MTNSPEQARKMLANHAHSLADYTLRQLFENDPGRFAKLSLTQDDMLLDFSRNRLTTETLGLLVDLAHTCNLEKARDAMFAGMPVSSTEGHPAMHTSLRHLEGRNTKHAKEIRTAREHMLDFAEEVREGTFVAADGSPYADVVNIGIGGSARGLAMATRALAHWHDGPRIHTLSNINGAKAADVLTALNPARTLVIVVSESFTTHETLTNTRTAHAWLAKHLDESSAWQQMVAASALPNVIAGWGDPESHNFAFSEWISGRMSIWSAAGLAIAIAVGRSNFESMLAGAANMDIHFHSAPMPTNLPVILGLVGVWNREFCNHATRAVFPCDRRLVLLPGYLQQLEMESNGKSMTAEDDRLDGTNDPLIWCDTGTGAQHSVFQFLDQSSDSVAYEFLTAALSNETEFENHHDILLANCLAQCAALAQGRTLQEARNLLLSRGMDEETTDQRAPRIAMPGNCPSTLIAYRKLNPFTLGRILALYEHQVFVESVIWNINPFDQIGVEFGKEIADTCLPAIETSTETDSMISGALAHLTHLRR